MARKTEGVFQLVQEVLRSISEPYGEDVIEDVFLEIEKNPNWLMQYQQLCDKLGVWVVSNWCAKHTKSITGLNSGDRVTAKHSRLITSYKKLI